MEVLQAQLAETKAQLAEAKAQIAAPKRTLPQMMRAPETCYGTCILSPSPKWVAAVASCGLDFVFIDTEHIPLNRSELSWMCNAYKLAGLPPLVRITEPDPYEATAAIDGGACGVVAPYMETVQQVRDLRGAVKLRPYKGARLAGKLAGEEAELPEHEVAYCAKKNAELALVLNIESQAAIDNLDEILAVPDIDCLLIGPHDLSCNLGVPEQFDHPKFVAAVRTIWTKARSAGVGAAIHQGKPSTTMGCTPADEINWIKWGCNVLVHGSDISLFTVALKRDIATIKAGVGEAVDSGPTDDCATDV